MTPEQRKDHRRKRLIELIDAHFHGRQALFSEKAQVPANLVSRYVTGAKGIGEDMRNKIEKNTGFVGWFDAQVGSVAQSPLLISLTDHPDLLEIPRVKFKLSAGVCGFAIDVEQGNGKPIFFRRDWFESSGYRPDKLFAVRIYGQSMEPRLWEGDLVVINTADVVPKDGEPFALNYEGELVIKRLRRDAGEWWACSDNPDQLRYAPKRCTEDVKIIGMVVYRQGERI